MPIYDERFPYTSELEMPVIGLEAEFKVFIDDVERAPEKIWRTPAGFVTQPLLKRTNKSMQLPTGGALYFDGGVIEVVTPVIEIAPQCTARVVRSLWEQIGFTREQLDVWERRNGQRVRLQAFSCHVNTSFELSREERGKNRTVQKLAVLLAHLLPVPLMVVGANRRSTGIGVRPRRERIEVTLDFTPDPGLMAATVALIVGIVRDVISWPSYRLDALQQREIPLIAGVSPGRHVVRKGWLTKDFHFPRNPFKTDLNEKTWKTTTGSVMSLREIAHGVAMRFRDSIGRYADPFSYRLLFSVLRGETPGLLDFADRPAAYDDVGRGTRWGSVLPQLKNFASLMDDATGSHSVKPRRQADLEERLAPPWAGENADRRRTERHSPDRRASSEPSSSSPLTRSAYEKVFLKLGAGSRLKIGDEILTPVKVKGWYHSIFLTPAGEERMLSIDQLLKYMGSWL
ncbi:MAG TPA: hypothetical protein VKL19_07525 [Thermoanaerobaculia bacterium]|nr:hypothetical protein [Thermoanaerobaculia bacterium]